MRPPGATVKRECRRVFRTRCSEVCCNPCTEAGRSAERSTSRVRVSGEVASCEANQ